MTPTQHKAKQFQAVKGVRDILPPESALWNRVEQAAREVFGSFGFAEIRLPIFERTELFARSVGQETDIVSKEMYSFEDRGQGVLTSIKDAIQIALVSPDSPDSVDKFIAIMKEYRSLLTT